MDTLGYLLVLAFLGQQKYEFDKNDKSSFEINKVGELAQSIFESKNGERELTKEDIKKGGLVDRGEKVKYYSNNLRNFILYHNISAEQDGFVITLTKKKDKSRVVDIDIDKKLEAIYVPYEKIDMGNVSKDELYSILSGYTESLEKKIYNNEIKVIMGNETNKNLEIKNSETKKYDTDETNKIKEDRRSDKSEKIKNTDKSSKICKEKKYNKTGTKAEETTYNSEEQIFIDKPIQPGYETISTEASYDTQILSEKELEYESNESFAPVPEDDELPSGLESPPYKFDSSEDTLQNVDFNQENYSDEELNHQNKFYSEDTNVPSFDVENEEEFSDFIPDFENQSSEEYTNSNEY